MNFRHKISILKRKIEYIYFSNLQRINNKKQGLAIIGCGRSGTTYTSIFFKSIGIYIGHERLKKDGISSWYLVSDQHKVPLGPTYYEIKKLDLVIVHQIRHPLQSVSSMQALGKSSWEFLSDEIDIDLTNDTKILMAMKYWYYWNLKAEKKSVFSYQIEKIDKIFHELLAIGNFPVKDIPNNISKKTNTRKHIDLNWSNLEMEDKVLTQKIKKLSIKYGYKVERLTN